MSYRDWPNSLRASFSDALMTLLAGQRAMKWARRLMFAS